MFKSAYARGVCKGLHDVGLVKFANEGMAAASADAVGETLPEQPVEDVPQEATAELASDLIELSSQLEAAAGQAAETATSAAAVGGEGAMPGGDMGAMPGGDMGAMADMGGGGMPPMGERVASLRAKISTMGSATDPDDMSQKNTPENAAQVTPEMEMENRERPPGYANVGEEGVGTQEDSGVGAVGHEEERVDQDYKAVDKDNSVIEAIKSGELQKLIRKVAQGGGAVDENDASQRNTPEQAAKVTPEGQRENTERPPEYAHLGPGKSDMAAQMRASAVGSEQAHPKQSPVKDGGTNSPIQQIAKSAEFDEYMKRFESCAQKYASRLPDVFTDEQKVASIKFLLGQDPATQEKVAAELEKAAAMPEGLKNFLEAKGEGNGEKKEEKKDEKVEAKEKDDEKKDEKKEDEKEASADVQSLLQNLKDLAVQTK